MDSIDVTINVTDISLSFSEGSSTTRSIQENSEANTNIGSAVTASNFISSRDDYVTNASRLTRAAVDGTREKGSYRPRDSNIGGGTASCL